jgi:hypothetical protein
MGEAEAGTRVVVVVDIVALATESTARVALQSAQSSQKDSVGEGGSFLCSVSTEGASTIGVGLTDSALEADTGADADADAMCVTTGDSANTSLVSEGSNDGGAGEYTDTGVTSTEPNFLLSGPKRSCRLTLGKGLTTRRGGKVPTRTLVAKALEREEAKAKEEVRVKTLGADSGLPRGKGKGTTTGKGTDSGEFVGEGIRREGGGVIRAIGAR